MAIYSLHHGSIGKSTQACPYTGGAHVRYITRPSTAGSVQGARLPTKPSEAAAWLNHAEDGDRKNARVIDKVMVALPRELTAEQRATLIRDYAEEISKGRAPWLAAIHDKGKDAENPHCHLIVRDRDPDTGRRVIGLSERGSTERLRQAWEQRANQALRDAGHGARIDRRTLKAQGIDRQPTIHEGPRAQAMARRGQTPRSRLRTVRSRPGARMRTRAVNYPQIDQGVSRPVHNLRVRETTAELWAVVDADRQARELEELRTIHHPPEADASVLGRGLLRHNSIQQMVPLSRRLSVFSGTFSIPAIAGSLLPSEALLEPSPNRVGERGNECTDAYAEGSKISTIEPVVKPLIIKRHENIIGAEHNLEKGNQMDMEKARFQNAEFEFLEAQRKADQSKARYDNAMKQSYLDPQKAQDKMNDYRARNGNEALYEKLNGNARKTKFGRRPGSILAKDGYTPGASDRRKQSHIARQNLGDLTRTHHQDQQRLEGARHARDSLAPTNNPQQTRGPVQSPSMQPTPQVQQDRDPKLSQDPAVQHSPQQQSSQAPQPLHNQRQQHQPAIGQQPGISQWHQRAPQPEPQQGQQPSQSVRPAMQGPAMPPVAGPAQPAMSAWHARQAAPGAQPIPSPSISPDLTKGKGKGPGM